MSDYSEFTADENKQVKFDELIQLLIKFMQQLEQYEDELSDAEALEIANFLNEVNEFIEEESQRVH